MNCRKMWLALGAFALAAALAPLVASPQETPDLAGTWALNQEQSDDAEEKIQEAVDASLGSTPRRPGLARRLASRRKEGASAELHRLLAAAETLTIQYQEPELMLRDPYGRGRAFYTDGRVVEQPAPGGGSLELTARWEGNELAIERRDNNGLVVTETYGLTGEGRQMTLTRRLESPRLSGPIVIRLIYDRVTDDGKAD
jgi:hypothetical protein